MNQLETNWEEYYERTPAYASTVRFLTTWLLARLLRLEILKSKLGENLDFIELGGGNSCLLPVFSKIFNPKTYTVIDKSERGLQKLEAAKKEFFFLRTYSADLIRESPPFRGSIVMSLGLIEHFDPADTKLLIKRHFELAKPGGLILITFPTPTILYRGLRRFAEFIKVWKFPDERPLEISEVLETTASQGRLLVQKVFWHMGFTQAVLLIEKHPRPQTVATGIAELNA